jgi:hypothetical protein
LAYAASSAIRTGISDGFCRVNVEIREQSLGIHGDREGHYRLRRDAMSDRSLTEVSEEFGLPLDGCLLGVLFDAVHGGSYVGEFLPDWRHMTLLSHRCENLKSSMKTSSCPAGRNIFMII